MAQISIDTLHSEGVIFVVNIGDMLPRFNLIVDIVSILSVRMDFLSIHYIGLVHPENFSHTSAAESAVVHFDC